MISLSSQKTAQSKHKSLTFKSKNVAWEAPALLKVHSPTITVAKMCRNFSKLTSDIFSKDPIPPIADVKSIAIANMTNVGFMIRNDRRVRISVM